MVKSLGLICDITHAEYLYNPDNKEIYLIEIAARGDGVYISSDLITLATGFNANEALIDYLVEDKKKVPTICELNANISAYVIFALKNLEQYVRLTDLKNVKK